MDGFLCLFTSRIRELLKGRNRSCLMLSCKAEELGRLFDFRPMGETKAGDAGEDGSKE